MTTILSRPMLDAHRFAPEQLDALFQAVLVDDEVDAHTPLPSSVTLDYHEDLLADCFRICRQLWREGADLGGLHALLARLRRDRDLDPPDRVRFKHIRARLKHFRFALALYGAPHRYPPMTGWLTIALGRLQDAYRTGQHARVRREALTAELFLSSAGQALLAREQDYLSLTSSQAFRAFRRRGMMSLAAVLAQPTVTGAEFHAARKVASREVSFYDTLRTISPSDEAYAMSRALAAVNGLMGEFHDRLVERRVAGVQDYHHARFRMPAEIGSRLRRLIRCHDNSVS